MAYGVVWPRKNGVSSPTGPERGPPEAEETMGDPRRADTEGNALSSPARRVAVDAARE